MEAGTSHPPPGTPLLAAPILMGKRRKARELGLQLLYQLDVQDEGSPVPHFDEFWTRHPVDIEVRDFTEGLVRGTKLHEGKIDELISQYAGNGSGLAVS